MSKFKSEGEMVQNTNSEVMVMKESGHSLQQWLSTVTIHKLSSCSVLCQSAIPDKCQAH